MAGLLSYLGDGQPVMQAEKVSGEVDLSFNEKTLSLDMVFPNMPEMAIRAQFRHIHFSVSFW